MPNIPLPTEVDALAILSEQLDAADHDTRVTWATGLNGSQMLRLYALAEGNGPLTIDDFLHKGGKVMHHVGKNGMPLFNRFEKRFVRVDDTVVGWNYNGEIAGPLTPVVKMVTGPGHYTAYDSPDKPNEVWVDYRTVLKHDHPEFPPVIDNEGMLRSLVFGNMVDILRRVSTHVFIGDSFKNMEPPGPVSLGGRIGSLLATAPFILVQPPQ